MPPGALDAAQAKRVEVRMKPVLLWKLHHRAFNRGAKPRWRLLVPPMPDARNGMPHALHRRIADGWKERRTMKSIWRAPHIAADGPLTADRSADVCVVGAGLAGLTTAYLMARDGHHVIVLDAAAIGGGESVRTTAHLVTALDRGWSDLVAIHGEEHARHAAASHAAAIDTIERIVTDEQIACDFARVDGHLFAAQAGDEQRLIEERNAAHAAGLGDVELAESPVLTTLGPSLRYPRQARLDAGCYLAGLAAAARKLDVTFAAPMRAIDVEEQDALRVRTAEGPTITAGAVVVATNTPFSTRVAFHVKQAAYRSYAVAAQLPSGAVPDALYWDTAEPFHYVRCATVDGETLLIVGGEDHKTGQDDDGPEARFDRLTAWMRVRFPMAGAVRARWSGQVVETMDGLAFIGPMHQRSRLFVVTGDCGNGYTHATLAGLLLRDLVAGRPNPWRETYDPSRVRMRAVGTAAAENANVAWQLSDWVRWGDSPDVADIPRGSGAIVRRGVTPIAVHRDRDGRVQERSAVCPHLGCIVRWNATEGSWDCPCHGSRFAPTGEVLNGPAHRPLGAIDDDDALQPSPLEV
jgi:glycine/D-amino acid oxidase-like deaminating enzyme/nitrite reductase/ring-hydroxylating ferredoxin subunit